MHTQPRIIPGFGTMKHRYIYSDLAQRIIPQSVEEAIYGKTPLDMPLNINACVVTMPSPEKVAPNGIITGFVMTGPTCPGPVTDGTTCPDTPVIHQQVQVTDSDGQMITTVMTNQKGQFTIMLAPGHYLLRANTSRVALHGASSVTLATILAGHTTSLRITVDTGIH